MAKIPTLIVVDQVDILTELSTSYSDSLLGALLPEEANGLYLSRWHFPTITSTPLDGKRWDL